MLQFLIKNIIQKNYKRKIVELKKIYGKRKIKVIFYVTENQKWSYQSLYELFEKDKNFEPLVLVSILKSVHKGKDKTRSSLEENYQFFKSRNMNVDYLYKNDDYLDLKKFEPDIIFYEQPWGLPKKYKPNVVSKYALTFYSDYGFELFCTIKKIDYTPNFHYLLYGFFADSILNIKRYETYKKGNSKNCIAIGYPKLDVYFENNTKSDFEIWKNSKKYKIIYAPHHTFDDRSSKLATFEFNGKFILDFAKKHENTSWIFKPHPRFMHAVIENNIMSKREIEDYFSEWKKVGKVYLEGDYFDAFQTSDLMITDCCSFLGEYLPTKKPIIRLYRKDSVPLNELGEKISSACYLAEQNSELEALIADLTKGYDPKKEDRLKIIPLIIDFNEKSSYRALKHIKQLMGETK